MNRHDAICTEALAAFSMMLRLGIAPEDLRVGAGPTFVFVQVLRPELSFVLDVGSHEGDPEGAMQHLGNRAVEYNAMTTEQQNELYEHSNVRKHQVEIVAALVLKGFTPSMKDYTAAVKEKS